MRGVRGSYILWEGRKGVGVLDDGRMKGCDGVGEGENKAKANTHWGPNTYHQDVTETTAKAKNYITFRAMTNPVGTCRTLLTVPALPSPSFLSSTISSGRRV